MTFANGAEALAYLKNTTDLPFVIVCDINMPLMNGFQLRKEINDDKSIARKRLPFVFLSTDTAWPTVEKAYDLAAQGFFKKENILEAIRNTFQKIIDCWAIARNLNLKNLN